MDDIRVGLGFYTRLPVTPPPLDRGVLARALWTGPLVGVLVGGLGAAAYGIAAALGLSPWLAGALAVGAVLAITGGLHEDGLADTMDGFGGGATPKRKLAIMRDSRIGTYGVSALVLALVLRVGALASLADATLVFSALVAAHAASRAALPALMTWVPPARTDGLSAGAGRPSGAGAVAAMILGVIALGFGLGPARGAVAFMLIGLASVAMAWLCRRQIGGQTGDVLGALQQIGEILILITAAAEWGTS
jgi:adenosylcobinamide-GDP ribazoletransferase